MRRDPLALAVLGAALALLAGLVLYVVFFLKTPEPAQPVRAFDFLPGLLREKLAGKAAPPPAPKPAAPGAPTTRFQPEAGRTWTYAVTVEPPVWRDITLAYRTERKGNAVGVQTEFKHAGGQMNFYLGALQPGDPAHANVRFPGFFLHPVYFQPPLEAGQRLAWEWAWQPVRAGRIKRYEAQVQRWEEITVPAGTFKAALIVADLYYVEGGKIMAKSRETFWYAPAVGQLVKVVREGRAPDEGSQRIVAELAQYR